jgi:hypothetical protein
MILAAILLIVGCVVAIAALIATERPERPYDWRRENDFR